MHPGIFIVLLNTSDTSIASIALAITSTVTVAVIVLV